MSENKRLTNDKLQGSVATHLTHGTVVNNQTEKGLLLSLSVKKKLKWDRLGQTIKCLSQFSASYLHDSAKIDNVQQNEYRHSETEVDSNPYDTTQNTNLGLPPTYAQKPTQVSLISSADFVVIAANGGISQKHRCVKRPKIKINKR